MSRFLRLTASALALAVAMPQPLAVRDNFVLAYPAAEAKILNKIAAGLFTTLLIRMAARGITRAVERKIISRISTLAHDPKNIQLLVEALTEVASRASPEAGIARDILQIVNKIPLKKGNPYNKVPSPSQVIDTAKFWPKFTTFGKMRVYQTKDAFDPKFVHNGISNVQRMSRGGAPIGKDGSSIELHHMLQKDGEAIAEVSRSLHSGYYKTLHINPSSTPSGISRSQFDAWRSAYWRARANDFSVARMQ